MVDLLVDRPIPGWYRRRLVRGGPWVPVLIYWRCPMGEDCLPLDRSPVLLCQVAGEDADPYAQWSHVAGNPISAIDYEVMVRQRAWDIRYDPASPAANPKVRVDIRALPPAF